MTVLLYADVRIKDRERGLKSKEFHRRLYRFVEIYEIINKAIFLRRMNSCTGNIAGLSFIRYKRTSILNVLAKRLTLMYINSFCLKV